MPLPQSPGGNGEGTSPHIRQLRVSLPLTLDAWVREQADALMLDKSAFVRMVLLQFKQSAEHSPVQASHVQVAHD